MEEKVKRIKMGKAELQEAFEHYWELFRKNVPLPSNDPYVVGLIKHVFESGFWAGASNSLRTTIEAIQQLKPSSEHPSNVIGINVNHDPSKAN